MSETIYDDSGDVEYCGKCQKDVKLIIEYGPGVTIFRCAECRKWLDSVYDDEGLE